MAQGKTPPQPIGLILKSRNLPGSPTSHVVLEYISDLNLYILLPFFFFTDVRVSVAPPSARGEAPR